MFKGNRATREAAGNIIGDQIMKNFPIITNVFEELPFPDSGSIIFHGLSHLIPTSLKHSYITTCVTVEVQRS